MKGLQRISFRRKEIVGPAEVVKTADATSTTLYTLATNPLTEATCTTNRPLARDSQLVVSTLNSAIYGCFRQSNAERSSAVGIIPHQTSLRRFLSKPLLAGRRSPHSGQEKVMAKKASTSGTRIVPLGDRVVLKRAEAE